MTVLKLEELIVRLPKGPSLPLEDHGHPSVSLPIIDNTFLHPHLKVIEGDSADWDSPIVVISAPGAVGKTSLASYIAASKNLFLWDLSRLKLGDNSFIGTIADCFGINSLSHILKDLEHGLIGFIFDALDEAQVLSGWQRVESFLNELCKFSKSTNKPCIVLLARSETASLIALHLQICRVPYKLLEIDYFNEEQAKEFILLQIKRFSTDRKKPELFSRCTQHQIHFQKAIESIFSTIYNAFSYNDKNAWDSLSIKSFLGYAPVLQAIAAFLSNLTNFQDVTAILDDGLLDVKTTRIVSRIMEDLLKREQGKLIGALKERKIPGSTTWDNWQILYSPGEQIERMLDFIQGNTGASIIESNTTIPGWLIEHYNDAVKTLLPQHPFIRNSVFTGPAFRDYVFAHLLKSSSPTKRKQTRSLLQVSTYVATPLFVQFYIADGTDLIWGEDAGFFYESVASRDTISNLSSAITVIPPSVSGNALHVFELYEDGSVEDNATIFLYIRKDTSTNIVFNRRIKNALLSVEGKVTLGNESNDFEISDCEIVSTEFELRSNNLIVQSTNTGQSTIIKALAYTQVAPVVDIQRKGPGSVYVSWPGSKQYPWSNYANEAKGDNKDDFSTDAYLALRRIFTWFKRDKKVDLARHKDLIQNAVVGDNPLRQLLLDYLIETEIIFRDHPLLKINVLAMSRHGINYSDLRKCKKNQSIDSFLLSFRKWIDKKAG